MLKKKTILLSVCGAVLIGLAAYFAWTRAHRGGSAEIVSMARSGATEAQMLDAIDHASSYKLTPDDVIALHQANISDKVIIAMLQKSGGAKQLASGK